MSDLSERLKRLGVLRGVSHLQSHATVPTPPRSGVKGIEHWVPGQVVHNDRGSFFLAEETFPLDHSHGGIPLSSVMNHSADLLVQLTGETSLSQLDLRHAVFLDTETTGLAGGTGTYAFLVGLGYFEGNLFRLFQFFMRDYSEESAMLHHIAEVMSRLAGIVSFNGRAFDLPLLETRFVLSRLQPDLLKAPHLDLLFPARRIWRARLASCALSSLEQGVLGLSRDGRDVPGYLIPDMYFRYLQTRNAAEIHRVFYHNAQDILSLVALASHVCSFFHAPDSLASADGLDLLSIGKLYERRGLVSESEQTYRHALRRPLPPTTRDAIIQQLSFLYKRLGRWHEAVELWETLRSSGQGSIEPHVELAKYYEHHARDYDQALAITSEARRRTAAEPRTSQRDQMLAELDYRISRLHHKTSWQSPH